ncbi:TPA: hypothetical protein RQN23_000664 [Aeromonas veronii]|nr:hypothetical protein [Aeromonas veronii]
MMDQNAAKQPTSEEVELRNALAYVLLQVNDIFRTEVGQSEFSLSSLKAFVSLTPNFGHKDFTEGMKDVFHDWYRDFNFMIEFTLYKDSLFLRAVRKPIHQSSGKKDIHFSDVNDAANGVRTFLKGVIREWKKESQKRAKEKKNSWIGQTIEAKFNDVGCVSSEPGKVAVNKIKNENAPFNSIKFEAVPSTSSDRVSLELSISVAEITPEKLERILNAIKGM